MDPNIKALVITTISAVGLLIIKEVFAFFRNATENNTRALEGTAAAIGELNKSIVKLECQFEQLNRNVEIIPKLEKDVNAAHRAIREMRNNGGA